MPLLTEQEQQDVIRHIEANKPLPEKYRFLLFEDKKEVELVWNGKNHEICNVVLPFQIIEVVDEPRADASPKLNLTMDSRGRQQDGWSNKLIWGDNKLVLSSLKNGPLREQIEDQGGLKLIYIDPPFDINADFSMKIEVGDNSEEMTKNPSILEEIAYRDTWGKGADSFIVMMYERLVLMKDLLAEDGSIFVHCDWRVSSMMDLVLAEVFGRDNFQNEIIWYYSNKYGANSRTFDSFHNTIFWYGKSNKVKYNPVMIPVKEARKQPLRKWNKDLGKNEWQRDSEGNYLYVDSNEKEASDVWEIPVINPMAHERKEVGYPTQKPEALVERIILAASAPGDLVADFFCGSGTTAAVAEKLGRKWIAADLGKFAIHTTRKRMIRVQRELKTNAGPYRAFEILNLGKYERQHFVGINPNLREIEQRQQQDVKEREFLNLILSAYKAERIDGFQTFHAKKNGRLVVVGPINLPVSRLFVEEVINECRQKRITRVDILGFEFEMGLFPDALDQAKAKGIDVSPKYIPAEVFDKRAIEKNQISFHDVSYIEVKIHQRNTSIAVELTDFSVNYSQDSISAAENSLKNKASKIVVEKGQIVKVSKDKIGVVSREVLTKKWTDWVDYWSVDYNYESKREVVRVRNDATGEWEDSWTGDYIFENEWQSFRTKKNPSLELTSALHECGVGRRKVAIKVVDIFGNDTMKIIEVDVGGKA